MLPGIRDTQLCRLVDGPLMRSLGLRPGVSVPAPLSHPTNARSAALQRRGHERLAEDACERCQRNLGRYQICVHLPDFFSGCCANCLQGGTNSCSLCK